MENLFPSIQTLFICIIAILLVVIVMVRMRLKKKSKELSEKLSHVSSYSEKSSYEQAHERISALNSETLIDIYADLNNVFCGKLISAAQEKDFINHYKPYFQEAYSLLKKLSILLHLKKFQIWFVTLEISISLSYNIMKR